MATKLSYACRFRPIKATVLMRQGGARRWGGTSPACVAPAAMLPHYKTARKSDDELYQPGASRFPYTDSFEIRKGLAINSRTVIQTLSPLLTDERLARFEAVCRGGVLVCPCVIGAELDAAAVK